MTETSKQTCDKNHPAWHNGLDVKRVQLKSAVNVYEGPIINMCAGCRKAYNGGFKLVKP